MSEKELSKIKLNRQRQEMEHVAAFNHYKEMIESAIDWNPQDQTAQTLKQGIAQVEDEDCVIAFAGEVAAYQNTDDVRDNDDLDDQITELPSPLVHESEETKTPTDEVRPLKPNQSELPPREGEQSWESMIDKNGRKEFNLIYKIMDKCRSDRFKVEAMKKITAEVK